MRLLSAVALTLLLPALTACSGLPGQHPMARPPVPHPYQRRREQALHLRGRPLDVLPTRLREGDDNRLSRRDKSLLERREACRQDEQLTQMLATRKYCRSGYIVLSQTSWKIRGECNESASQADRDAFPNQAGWQE